MSTIMQERVLFIFLSTKSPPLSSGRKCHTCNQYLYINAKDDSIQNCLRKFYDNVLKITYRLSCSLIKIYEWLLQDNK